MEQELVWQEVHGVTRTSTATTSFEAVAISLELSQRCRLFPRTPRSGGRGGLGPGALARRSLAAIVTRSAREVEDGGVLLHTAAAMK